MTDYKNQNNSVLIYRMQIIQKLAIILDKGENIFYNSLLFRFQDALLVNNNFFGFHHLMYPLLLVRPRLSVVWSEVKQDVFNGLRED